jgi:hypothetical protein
LQILSDITVDIHWTLELKETFLKFGDYFVTHVDQVIFRFGLVFVDFSFGFGFGFDFGFGFCFIFLE